MKQALTTNSKPCRVLSLHTIILLLLTLWSAPTAQAKPPAQKPRHQAVQKKDECYLFVDAYTQNESTEVCTAEPTTLFAFADYDGPGGPFSGTISWQTPPGVILNTYTGDEVIATFTTSGPQTVTVTATDVNSCTASRELELTANPAPDVTIFFPNSLTTVQVSGVIPTVSQTVPQNTIQAFGGVFYEWMVVIDRVGGYEIRQGNSNDTGIFDVPQVGPYTLTVTGANGCKRTVRGILTRAPAPAGGN